MKEDALQSLLIAGFALLAIVVTANLALTLMLIRRINRVPAGMGLPPGMEVGLKKDTPAPDFRAETLSGEPVTLADYAHKAVSFIFISSKCPPCVEKLPALQALAPQARQAGVEIVLVTGDSDRATISALVTQYRITLPVLIAPFEQNSFLIDYKAQATPSYCTLNQHGRVAGSGLMEPGWEKQLMGDWVSAGHPSAHPGRQVLPSAG
jgi:peroxiredoxin